MTTHIASEALDRRARSEAILRKEGVPINDRLPVIETTSDVLLRSKEEIGRRALCLLMIAIVAKAALEGDSYDLNLMAEGLGVEQHLSAAEVAYMMSLFSPNAGEADSLQFVWRYESAWTLLWALGHVETLDAPVEICNVDFANSIVFNTDPEDFIKDSKLRPLDEILDQADRIYRYHWAVVNARLQGNEEPAGLMGSVVYERHYALNWLVGHMDQDWDSVSTDT